MGVKFLPTRGLLASTTGPACPRISIPSRDAGTSSSSRPCGGARRWRYPADARSIDPSEVRMRSLRARQRSTIAVSVVAGRLFDCLVRSTGAGTHSMRPDEQRMWSTSDASDEVTSIAYKRWLRSRTDRVQVTPSTGSQKFAAIVWQIKDAYHPPCAPGTEHRGYRLRRDPKPAIVTPTGGAKEYLFMWLGGWEGEQTSPPATQPRTTPRATTDQTDSDSAFTGRSTSIAAGRHPRHNNAASEEPGVWTIERQRRLDGVGRWRSRRAPPAGKKR